MPRVTSADVVHPLRILSYLAIIATLYLSSEVAIPVALAILVTFLLYPVVNCLHRWGLHRAVAVGISVGATVLVTLAFAFLLAGQVVDLTTKLPDYQDNLRHKVRQLRPSEGGQLARLTGTFAELKKELVAPPSTTQSTTGPAAGATTQAASVLPAILAPIGLTAAPAPTVDHVVAPVKVEVVSNGMNLGEIAASIATPILYPLAEAGVTLLIVIFLLMYFDNLRERLITFAGLRRIGLTTTAVDEIGTRIGRFLRMQAIVNIGFGTLVGVGLMLIGVPNWPLWGALAGAVRFIPYVGPWIGAAGPTLLTVAIFPGWAKPVEVLAVFFVIEFITSMVLEPWLYGHSSGITSLGVVLAAVFWGWVWGPIGMILAVPITTCLVVTGKHVPQLAWLHQLFGSDVTLSRVGRYYQRLLVGDEEAACKLIGLEVAETSFAATCDSILLPTLSELKRDMEADDVHMPAIKRALEIVDLCSGGPIAAESATPHLICLAVQNEVDACAARLLVRAAHFAGLPAMAVSSDALAAESAKMIEEATPKWVALVQVPPISAPHAKRLAHAISQVDSSATTMIDFSFNTHKSRSDAPGQVAPTPVLGNMRRERLMVALIAHLTESSLLQVPPKPNVGIPPGPMPEVPTTPTVVTPHPA